MSIRDDTLETVKRILVGPNPLPGFTQKNGEEILFNDSPLQTYVTGVLFPQTKLETEQDDDAVVSETAPGGCNEIQDILGIPGGAGQRIGEKIDTESIIETEAPKINNYRQSAMGITVCVPQNADELTISISVGSYFEQRWEFPIEQKSQDRKTPNIVLSGKMKKCYFRKQHESSLLVAAQDLPTNEDRHKKYKLYESDDKEISGLEIAITFRMFDSRNGTKIYTVTLLNSRTSSGTINPCDCWYQVGFSVGCRNGFLPLPDNFSNEIDDSDYKLNALLYRDVKTYAIGHGCAATWDDSKAPFEINATVLPEYDVKPILPTSIDDVHLSMKLYSSDKDRTIRDLKLLCEKYKKWIEKEERKIQDIDDKYKSIAENQIKLCRICLNRMEVGVTSLTKNELVLKAFQLANRAMLMQQLHYKLPLTNYIDYDKENFCGMLERPIAIPDFNDESTWYDNNGNYGRWRPFQIAFLLMNLISMYDKNSKDRGIVDLIWFPTGGGKTEAYLGLTAYTIFLRRLKNPNDSGTAVIMRYTLRLLTAQQYERAASLICSMEKIRAENPKLLGTDRITIGLWVGDSLTENNTNSVISKIKEIHSGKSSDNVSVILKCPWCGASMETYRDKGGANHTPGYSYNKTQILFKCDNDDCAFHDIGLPLCLFDDDIYEHPPTLLFGTVDKFAMLPFRPEAKSLFGGESERTPPELIIQDELHLITGPLGSTVGLYEILIDELCKCDGTGPKIVASTATISHAKQQCNALYDCGEENVFQFPVQGTSYRDCFFAEENKNVPGRKYVGLYGAAATSSATASIYTFAAFLYAVKHVVVHNEKDRDPYWTNLAYFGSMRELGQAATWFIADIKEHLEVIYRSRMESSLDESKRRFIYENGLAELTSRMSNGEIPKILKRLEIRYGENDKRPLDVCLSTNMVSVGVDIPRLGLMTVTGQPKSMSEYIQATSRVGRSSAPGLVFVIYNTSKSRDKSHYEKFQSQHAKLYYGVEPTSVTPFSRPLRERALHAVFVALFRFFEDIRYREDATKVPSQSDFEHIVDIIVSRAGNIDPDEVEDIKKQLKDKWEEWRNWKPTEYDSFFRNDETAPLMYPFGTLRPASWDDRGWFTPTSMRNVDRECGLDCSRALITEDD